SIDGGADTRRLVAPRRHRRPREESVRAIVGQVSPMIQASTFRYRSMRRSQPARASFHRAVARAIDIDPLASQGPLRVQVQTHLMATTMSKLLKAYDRSRVPLYIQVAAVMRQRIERRQWQPGQKISTLVELEREFEVARVTVRQAVDILRQEGLLHCYQGRGTFVAEK